MMDSTITDMIKTSVERKLRGGYRFTIDLGTQNTWQFDLTEGEFHELYKQMTHACGATPIGLVAIPEPSTQAQTDTPQPPPTGNGQIVLWQAIAYAIEFLDLAEADWLCLLLHERAIAGKEKYGTWLRANNGRDAAIDYLQEALDALMYATQEWLETSSDSARAKQEAALAAIMLCYEDRRTKVVGKFDGFGKEAKEA